MRRRFDVTILGVNSAFPVHGRHPSCQIVNFDERFYMIDCGEAAQIQILKYKIKRSKLDHIFISHMHGDHCYGLPGLITSFSLEGRSSALYLHGPIGIKKFIDVVLEVSGAYLSYELVIKEYDTERENEISINDNLIVRTFPMKHRGPTMGFRFEEVITEMNIDPAKIREFKLTIDEIKDVKKGGSIIRNDVEIACDEIVFPKPKPRSYSYCSDTVYDLELIPFIENSTLLYHETTYLTGLEKIAGERMHSTLGQAIDIAQKSNITRLIVGHYSSRYSDTSVFLDEGLPHFSGLMLGEEGAIYTV